MHGLDVPTFAFRLAAVFVWVTTVSQAAWLTAFFVSSRGELRPQSWVGFAISLALSILLGVFLWTSAQVLARRALGGSSGGTFRGATAYGTLALRLAGCWLLDRAIQRIPDFQILSGTGIPESTVGPITALAVLTAGAIVLLVFANRIARVLFRPGPGATSVPAELQPIAFSVLGLAILLPGLASSLSLWLSIAQPPRGSTLMSMALGLFLFLGAGPLARAWRWARTAGLDRRARSS